MLKGLIIEDEHLAAIRLSKMLSEYSSHLELIGKVDTGSEAIERIEKEQPDLLFLDIQLPDMTGFELLALLSYQPLVIFTTAYEQYAIQAFDTHSIDYLIKPFRVERLKRAMEKLIRFGTQNKTRNFPPLENLVFKKKEKIPFSLPIKLGNRILLVDFEDIAYLKAEEKYIRVVTKQGKSYLSDGSLKKFESTIPDYFIRVHGSYILNQRCIKEIRRFFKGKLILVLDDTQETRITTGETYSKKVRQRLGL